MLTDDKSFILKLQQIHQNKLTHIILEEHKEKVGENITKNNMCIFFIYCIRSVYIYFFFL